MSKVFFFACVILLGFSFLYLFFSTSSATAATATSNCVITNVGSPGSIVLPPGCNSGKWPFARKDPSEYRRIDAGFDIQENHIEDTATGKTWLYAIAAGTVHLQCCTGGGYGPHYPYVTLDQPISYHGKTHKNYFYGHTVMIPQLNGKHVNAGDKIAWTGPQGCTLPGESWCGNGGPYWAEIGWGNSYPEGNNDPNVCINQGNLNLDPLYNHGDPCAWTQSGKDMKDYLLGNP